jgi:hypothetical protein
MKTISEYAPFGTVTLPTGGTRPEPTPAERAAALRADQVGHFDYIRECGWSDESAAMAQRCGLLPPNGDCGGTLPIIGSDGYQRGQPVVYSRQRLAERAAALRAFVVQKLK